MYAAEAMPDDNDQEMELPKDDRFPKLSAPARRRLSAAGDICLHQLAQASESDPKKLHGRCGSKARQGTCGDVSGGLGPRLVNG